MKTLIAIIAIAAATACSVGQADATPAPETPEQVFMRLVRTHPNESVREVEPLFDDGTLTFATRFRGQAAERLLTSMAAYLREERLFLFSADFLVNPEVPDCARMIVIRHEVEHYRDHAAGLLVLPRSSSSDDFDSSTLSTVRTLFQAEWRAKLAELELREAIPSCPYFPMWAMDDSERCSRFKEAMKHTPGRLPHRALELSPPTRDWVERLRCEDLLKED